MKPSGLLWILTGVLWAFSRPAVAETAQEVVERLNVEGMQALGKGDVNRAGAMLEEALRVSKQGKVSPAAKAASYANLAAVYIDGLKDQQSGVALLLVARCFDANVRFSRPQVSRGAAQALQASAAQVKEHDCRQILAEVGEGQVESAPAVQVSSIVHLPVTAQQASTPLPLYAELNRKGEVEQVFVCFRGSGMDQFERAPMYVFGRGLAYQIGCNYLFAPGISYYLEAVDGDGRVVAQAGSAEEPYEVLVQAEPVPAPPSLPGREAPSACSSSECPPGLTCEYRGLAGITDTCSLSQDCQPGLSCEDEVCQLPGSDGTDVEDLEWDGEAGVSDEPAPAFFASVSLAMALSWLDFGLPADRDPDRSRVFVDVGTGNFVTVDGTTSQDRLVLPDADSVAPEFHAERATEWVPDADSNDSLSNGQGIGGQCPADGIKTGPGLSQLFPSSYCVRVQNAGLVPMAAMRLTFGYFFSEQLAGSVVGRFQLSGGEGMLAQLLFGVRGEWAFLGRPREEGFFPSVFVGATLGQIQVQPDFEGDDDDLPWAQSGVVGVHVGASFRYRFHRNFGLIASPEFDLQFPNVLQNVDLPIGIEVAF